MQALGATHDLIVCVDCGTLSHDPIAAAGCDVIVLDHHLGAETLPPALAVVNPNRQDEDGSLGHLCAAAVVFLMLVAVNRLARGEGATGPDLLGFLDLVALATVADVAPLTGLNRALVRQGLTRDVPQRAPRPHRPGRSSKSERPTNDLRPRLHLRSEDQRRRPHRRGRPRRPPPRDRRPARGGRAGSPPAHPQRRAPRDRGRGPRRRRGPGRGPRRRRPAGLGRRPRLASRRRRHRRGPAQGDLRPPRRGDRLRRRRGQGLGALGHRRSISARRSRGSPATA